MTSFAEESRPILDLGSLGGHPQATGADLDDDRDSAPSPARTETRTETRYRALATGLVATATVVRFVSMASVPLGNGEAYYFTWSRFPSLSYYDHPPLIAWLVRLTTAFGASPAAVRLGPILASGAFGLLFYRLAERLLRPRAAFLGLVLVTALPVFLASSFIVNPEAPLAPLWVAYLLVIEAMRREDKARWPLFAGALLGFAFLAKYTAVLLVPATFLYFLSSSPMRRWLRRPSFYAGGAAALVVASPVLFWNELHGWATVHLHLAERVGASAPVPGENTVNQLVAVSSSSGTSLLESVGRLLVGQAMSYSPILAPLLVLGLAWAVRGAIRRSETELFVTAFTWPVLLPLLAAMTVLKDAEQHWTMMAFVPAAMAAGHLIDCAWADQKLRAKWVRGLFVGGVALSAVAFVVAHVHARTTALLRVIPPSDYDPRADMVNELVGWDQVRAGVLQASQAVASSGATTVLASNHYSLCGRLFFETGDSPSVYCPTARRSAFDFFERREPPRAASVVVLTTDIHPEMPAGLEGRSCNAPDPIDIERGGRRVARYFIRTCAPATPAELRASRD
jgi:Dolichyl-phosphate-mannose-protein mannosyltransferase